MRWTRQLPREPKRTWGGELRADPRRAGKANEPAPYSKESFVEALMLLTALVSLGLVAIRFAIDSRHAIGSGMASLLSHSPPSAKPVSYELRSLPRNSSLLKNRTNYGCAAAWRGAR